MEIAGLPLHPLVVHAAVGVVPLSALATWAFALVPSWRWLTRWVALVLAVSAVGVIVVARESGKDLFEEQYGGQPATVPAVQQAQTHADRADVLLWVVIALAVLVALAFWLLPGPSGLVTGRLDHRGNGAAWVTTVVPAALVVLALVAFVWVVLTGDAGARAHWTD
jgi:hypothetical protein